MLLLPHKEAATAWLNMALTPNIMESLKISLERLYIVE